MERDIIIDEPGRELQGYYFSTDVIDCIDESYNEDFEKIGRIIMESSEIF